MKTLPTLYSKSVKGSLQQWTIFIQENSFYTESGQVGGKITKSLPTYVEQKNIGKKNETTLEEQAYIEALAKWNKRKKEGYVEDKDNIPDRPFIKPILAHPYKNRRAPITFPVLMNIKYNGVRCIITKDGAFSRKGEEFFNIKHIIEQLQPLFESYPDLVLDGELNDPKDQQNLNRLIKLVAVTRKEKDITDDLIIESEKIVRYTVYDGYLEDQEEVPYNKRFEFICDILNKPEYFYCHLAPFKVANEQDDIINYFEEITSQKMEGIILRIPDMPYEHKRTFNLLKIKGFDSDEFEVVDIIEGNGDWRGRAKKIVCKLDENTTFKSNVRGTMEFCKDILDNKNDYIGKIITVEFQERSEYGVPLIPYTSCIIRNYE